MGFNENAFMIIGTTIAIFGVGLYLYDTRKDAVINTYNQYRQVGGGSRKNNKKQRKTRKRY